MRLKAFVLSFLSVSVLTSILHAGPPDSQGTAVLVQSLSVAGGAYGLNRIQDFTATGSITYFWAGEQVQGAATVRARGADQFRLDANLPEGTRSYAVNLVAGAFKDTDGNVTAIPSHNTLNVGVLTFPYLTLLARLNDPLTAVSYLGVTPLVRGPAHQVRVERHFSSDTPDSTLANLCTTDYFVDAQTFLLLKTLDMTHPVETLTENYTREIEFQNYQPLNGVNVPTLVREKIAGQTTWELRLTSIALNTGLTDFDFTL